MIKLTYLLFDCFINLLYLTILTYYVHLTGYGRQIREWFQRAWTKYVVSSAGSF